jgi:hypothetical protein
MSIVVGFMYMNFSVRKVMERNHVGYLGIDKHIILKWKVWIGFIRIETLMNIVMYLLVL